MNKNYQVISLICCLLFGVTGSYLSSSEAAEADDEVDKMMRLVPQWMGGHYSTQKQYDSDQASNNPDSEKHRLMFQLFQRIENPHIPGIVFFEQGSMEGTTDPDQVWRAGLIQFLPDPDSGVVRHRELAFKEQKKFVNAHLRTGAFKDLSLDMVTWDVKCDFLLKLSSDGAEMVGTMPDRVCKKENPGTGKVMYAVDKIVIRPGEFWFLGRYVGEDGQIVWGNESNELNKLVRFKNIP